MQTSWLASYLDGRTAARHSARVSVNNQFIQVTTDSGHSVLWPLSEVRQTQGFYSGEPIRLERGAPIAEVVIVDDRAFLEHLHRVVGPERAKQFSKASAPNSRLMFGLLAGGATVALIALLYFYVIPASAARLAPLVPLSVEEKLGDVITQMLAPPEKRCNDARLQAAVEAIMKRLSEASGDSRYQFRIAVFDDQMVNAFAAPGGYVVVARGLLEKTDSPEQLAGVLAHEVQHVLLKHSTGGILRQLSSRVVIALVAGDASLVEKTLSTADSLGQLKFGRDAESAADLEGLALLTRAGVPPQAMIDAFGILEREAAQMPSMPAFLSSHPETADRIAELKARGVQMKVEPRRFELGEDWSSLRARCWNL
jgi:beta-barrel assembly-enhancing protease